MRDILHQAVMKALASGMEKAKHSEHKELSITAFLEFSHIHIQKIRNPNFIFVSPHSFPSFRNSLTELVALCVFIMVLSSLATV
jgi:hypothetical protein